MTNHSTIRPIVNQPTIFRPLGQNLYPSVSQLSKNRSYTEHPNFANRAPPVGKMNQDATNSTEKFPKNSIESWPISFRGTHHELSLGSDTGRRKTVKTTVTFVHYLRQLLTDNLKLNALLIIYAMTPSSPHPPWWKSIPCHIGFQLFNPEDDVHSFLIKASHLPSLLCFQFSILEEIPMKWMFMICGMCWTL